MLLRHYFRSVLMVLVFALMVTPALAQEGDQASEELDPVAMSDAFTAEFNRVLREDYDARALARNAILDEVAQRIARQVGCTEDRVEFDIQRDVQTAGYLPYPDENTVRTTRVPLVPAVNARPIEEIATFYTPDIFENNINQAGRFYREIGVGVSPCIAVGGQSSVGSTQQYGLFIILGSQPNVIPVVIENGASKITAAEAPVEVTLSIHEENTRQRDGVFGITKTVRLSNTPIDDSTKALTFLPTMKWELESCGENTLYYELTDAAGNVVTGETPVEVVCE